MSNTAILDMLREISGPTHVLQGERGAAFYTDVYRTREPAEAVVQPKSIAELQQIVSSLHQNNVHFSVRGGGSSYTDGYLSERNLFVLLDLSRLNQITELNIIDGYVTVEAGVTWAQLQETLNQHGLRTPFLGPFSGLIATVGGSIAQHAVSHSSGTQGISSPSVLSMDIVLPNGKLLSTGSASAVKQPFLRHFGPDLTGLFTGDCGTLGIKARITMPLIKQLPAHRTASFAFSDFNAMHQAMRTITQEQLEDTQFALDAALSRGQIARQERMIDFFPMAKSLFNSSPNLLAGFKQLFKAMPSSKRPLSNMPYRAHYIVAGVNDAEVKARLHRIRQITGSDAREIPATVPAVIKNERFAPLLNTLGPKGERWVPLHGILPHSKVADFHKALDTFFAARETDMQYHNVWYGRLFSLVEGSGFIYQIAIYWPDEITAYHRKVVPEDYLNYLPDYPANPKARAYVDKLKNELIDLFVAHDAVNFQLGKSYPYASRLAAEPLQLIKDIQRSLNPKGLLSSGNLELP